MKTMEENRVNPTPLPGEEQPAAAPAPEAQPGGISFGGGADNQFIRKFAADPQYDRTLEEIAIDERKTAGGAAEDARREKIRAQARRRMTEHAAQYDSPYLTGQQPEAQPQPMARPMRRSMFIDPLEEEIEAEEAAAREAYRAPEAPYYAPPEAAGPAAAPAAEEEAPAETEAPLSGFAAFLSESKGFSVYSVVVGAVCILYSLLYFFTVMLRSIVLSNTERTLLLQGQTAYTITFTSPFIGLLKVMMYLLPVLFVVWAIVFKRTDGKKYRYNKKTVIALLCLGGAAMLVTVIDLMALHLMG